ncbi:UPF0149 family protein [uncultured Microbulbifer sp.]|uniref:UPF0149 family protein n=1 Tax=uncultured Microbulbifer sp. TaxID=348147 RepID=UPI0025F9610C|nr:UPF0149 family protein [uncultured Microbulbifer sp.]
MAAADSQFDHLASQVLAAGGKVGPSELHGFICGLLASGARPQKSRWQKELAEFLDLDAMPADLQRDSLQLAESSLQSLSDSSFSFQPLLAGSDDLAEKGQSLCLWCQGFLHGFGLGNYSGELLPTSSEALKDLTEISQLDAEQMETTPEQEAQLFEVQEYVRMAALNIFVECSGPADSAHKRGDGHTVH